MNTIWFFGTSLTKGSGVLKGEKMYNPKKKIFAEIIAGTLGYHLKNFGVIGGCNEWTIHNILKQAKSFKPGDIVVACNTLTFGYIQYLKSRKKVISINDTWFDDNDYWYNNDYEKKILLEYRKIRRKYEKEYNKFYQEDFDNIEKLLNKLGIHMISWQAYEWWENPGKYENITKASNGLYKDMHFSYKGHESMANHILGLMYDKFSFLKKPLN